MTIDELNAIRPIGVRRRDETLFEEEALSKWDKIYAVLKAAEEWSHEEVGREATEIERQLWKAVDDLRRAS
jgi:hypothetical protein